MEDHQLDALIGEISRLRKELEPLLEVKDLNLIADELKNIRVIMAADLLLKTYQHTEDADSHLVQWPITELIDVVQNIDYHPDETTSS